MSEKKGRGRPRKYDWDLWGDGNRHHAFKGTDFACTRVSFRALIHRTANDRGAVAETSLHRKDPNGISFRFIYKD